ncbi:hypothetical protein [Mycobacterium uberis]|uniref:hypothetical protein n=1 Tax=Mycobacterium uberis TaxID=2162698 RepID=UPI0026BCB50C
MRRPYGLTMMAIDLSDVRHTVWSQFDIGIVVLIVVGIAGYPVVHPSLRPLAEID